MPYPNLKLNLKFTDSSLSIRVHRFEHIDLSTFYHSAKKRGSVINIYYIQNFTYIADFIARLSFRHKFLQDTNGRTITLSRLN